MRRSIWLLISVVLATASVAAVRPAQLAGSFYPASSLEVSFQIDKFLTKVSPRPQRGEIVALIVPHAGYPYSGQTAAYAYKLLAGQGYDRVILLGASHRLAFDEIAAPDYTEFATPLGEVPVDREFISRLGKLSERIKVNNAPFDQADNALEVQLPFLQSTLGEFKIVPLFFGAVSLANCQSLAYALNYLVDDRTLIVASTDWSHYYPDYLGRKMDREGLKAVVEGSLEAYIGALARGETEACGAPAVITTMLLAPALGANRTELLKYANSGVGYASVVYYRAETSLTAGERQKLLKIARRTLESKLAGKKLPIFTPPEESLNERRGVFVTLTEDNKLRGCIGYVQPVKPLFAAVQEMAVQAATNDPRFLPVAKEDLVNIRLEISVLSRLRRLREAAEIMIGRDGLYIIRGEESGLLLPQVALAEGWDRDEFLKQVCLKAGLPEDAWREPETLLFRFSAEVWREP